MASERGVIDYDQIRQTARTGDGPRLATAAGTLTNGNLHKTDAAGNVADAGIAVDADPALAANSDSKVPTQKAVKAYADAHAGSGAVSSVFTRTGAVVAATGDYTAAQVTNAVSTTGSYPDPGWITSLSWGKITGAPALATASLGITIDGGGGVITAGVKGYLSIPFGCTITAWDIVADQAGSISIDVCKHAGSVPNTTTDKISASAPIALSSAQLVQGGAITGWTTAVAAGDVIGFNVTGSPASVTRVTATVKVTKT